MQESVVVENIVVVDSAVVNLVLEKSQKKMIADWILTRRRLRSSHEEDPITCSGGERKVMLQPMFPILVPVVDSILNRITQFRIVIEGFVVWVLAQISILGAI